MKKIEAIIRPEKLNDVLDKLESIGYSGITMTEVSGHGRQKGVVEQFRGKEYKLRFIPKIKIEIVVAKGTSEKIIEVLCNAAATGEVGDGKIFVWAIEDTIRVRTKERGEGAI